MDGFIRAAAAHCARVVALSTLAIAGSGAIAHEQDLRGNAVFSDFGWNVGADGFVFARNGHDREIYAAARGHDRAYTPYWYALHYAKDGSAKQIFVSEPVPAGIAQISVARQGGGKPSFIVVAARDGTLQEFDQKTKKLVAARPGDCAGRDGLTAFTATDIDGDGIDEYISVCGDETLVVSGPHFSTWTLPGVGGDSVFAANLDDDPALEIVTGSGAVVDSAKHRIQWRWTPGFGKYFAIADLGLGKSYPGLITTDKEGGFVAAFDIGAKVPVWTLDSNDGVGGMAVADIDEDGKTELVIADAQWGNITAYDLATRSPKGQLPVMGDGAANMLLADVTGDGHLDLIWGSQLDFSCGDCIYTGQWATKSVSWHSSGLEGPFLGPWVGDIDGDGKPEIVFASHGADGLQDSGRLIVLDGETLKLRGVSDPFMNGESFGGLNDIRLRDLGDGRLSALLAGDVVFNGSIEAWHFNADNTFDLVWENAARIPGTPFTAADAKDVDGSGIVAIVGMAGSQLSTYDVGTGGLTWQSAPLKAQGTAGGLGIADFDGDGRQEMIVQTTDGLEHVFDGGGTHAVKSEFTGANGAFSTFQPAGQLPELQLGSQAGRATQWGWNGQHYHREFGWSTSGQPIVGLTQGPSGDWWVGTGDGVLTRYHDKTAVQSTVSYGSGTGSYTAFLPSRGLVLTGGAYGVFAFRVATP